jgi:hypothetical protein
MQSFFTFAKEYYSLISDADDLCAGTPENDFVKDMVADSGFPRSSRSLEAIINHVVVKNNACDEAKVAFLNIAVDYLHYKSVVK